MDNDIQDDFELPKSKSQVKRDMLALQELGEHLVRLNNEQLNKLSLPPLLFQAIQEAKRLTNRGAKRRQMQYIGRLMRDLEDPTRIKEFIQKLTMKDQRATAIHHMLEDWRERLLSDDQNAITEFINLYPHADRQHLRQLIQSAKKERSLGNIQGSGRSLFRYLRELQEGKDQNE